MNVLLRIPVLLVLRCRIRLFPVIVSPGRAFALLSRVSIRTSYMILLTRIRRRVWLSSSIVRCCRRTLGMNIRIYSCCRRL